MAGRSHQQRAAGYLVWHGACVRRSRQAGYLVFNGSDQINFRSKMETAMKSAIKGMKYTTMAAAIASLGLFAQYAAAESNFQSTTGTGSLTAPAKHDFKIVIPKFLFLQVGTGTSVANNATVDMITFDVPAANVGDSTQISGTGGTAGGGTAATVVVKGNNGQVTLTETNNGTTGLSNGTDSISYSEIQTTSSNTSLPAPALSNASGNTSLPTVASKITNQTATWTYKYLNTTTPPAGTYGTSTNGGRVTYTATMP